MPRNQEPSYPSTKSGRRSSREDFDPEDRESERGDDRIGSAHKLRDDDRDNDGDRDDDDRDDIDREDDDDDYDDDRDGVGRDGDGDYEEGKYRPSKRPSQHVEDEDEDEDEDGEEIEIDPETDIVGSFDANDLEPQERTDA